MASPMNNGVQQDIDVQLHGGNMNTNESGSFTPTLVTRHSSMTTSSSHSSSVFSPSTHTHPLDNSYPPEESTSLFDSIEQYRITKAKQAIENYRELQATFKHTRCLKTKLSYRGKR